MPVPPPASSQIHDFAIAAMQGLLVSEAERRSIELTARRKYITFNQELSIEAYDIAEALMLEGKSRP